MNTFRALLLTALLAASTLAAELFGQSGYDKQEEIRRAAEKLDSFDQSRRDEARLRGENRDGALPLFNATLTMGKEHRFVLVDANGKASGFLALGESFAGYKLKAFDVKEGALELEKDGKVSRVTLVADAATVGAPAARIPATIADAEAVLNKMHFEEMMERAMQGQKKMLASQFQRMSAQMASQGVDAAEVAAFQKKITDEVFSVLDAKTLKNDVSKIYSEVFSKDELDQISAFYSTPLGEMLNKRQPEVQEKLGTIIQGRMMEVMPRVQKMGQEFAAEQKAKKAAAAGGAVPTPAPKP